MLELTVKEGFLEETAFDLRPDTGTGKGTQAEGPARVHWEQACVVRRLGGRGWGHTRQQVSDGLSSFLLTSAIHRERSGLGGKRTVAPEMGLWIWLSH